MEFVFSQTGKIKLGLEFRFDFFGNYGKGVSVGNSLSLSWTSFSECETLPPNAQDTCLLSLASS